MTKIGLKVEACLKRYSDTWWPDFFCEFSQIFTNLKIKLSNDTWVYFIVFLIKEMFGFHENEQK